MLVVSPLLCHLACLPSPHAYLSNNHLCLACLLELCHHSFPLVIHHHAFICMSSLVPCPSMSSIHPCLLLLVHFIFHVILVFLCSCHLQMTTVWVIWLIRCSSAHIQSPCALSSLAIINLTFVINVVINDNHRQPYSSISPFVIDGNLQLQFLSPFDINDKGSSSH